jgi:hypothetical protein
LAAGVATMTASASTRWGVGTGPQSSAKPAGVRRIARTVTPVRTRNLPDAASAVGSRPSPPTSDAKTGPEDRLLAAASVTARAACSSEPP